MHFILDTAKVVEVFCFIDDFCKEVQEHFASHPLPKGLLEKHPAGRKPALSESEVLTILTLYHLSGFKCFEYYYERLELQCFTGDFFRQPQLGCTTVFHIGKESGNQGL
ncbi:hypothetical protein ACFQ2O_17450, partial [Pontibacter rugosus]